MSDEYVQQLTSVLLRVTSARSTIEVKSATDELQKNWYKRKETVVALVRILQSHDQPHIRQLCAVEVRKLIPKFWYETSDALDADTIEEIKASLLQNSLKEDNELVRHNVARIISTIASLDLDAKRWSALLPELSRAAQSGDVRERETATYVLYALLDSADYCEAPSEDPNALFQILSQTIDDPESLASRVNSVHALCGLSASLSGPAAAVFQPFIPKIVAVLRQCVDASDDKSAIGIFENLSDLIDSDPAVLGPAFGDLLAHMLNDYGLNRHIEPDLRVAAVRVVSVAVSFRSRRIKRENLGPELTRKLVEVVANCDDDDDEDDQGGAGDDEDDDDVITPKQLALQTLAELSTELPPSMVITPLLHLLPSLIQAPNVRHQCAAFLAFTSTAEQAPEFVRSEMTTLLPWVTNGLKSEHAPVRFAALGALVALCEIDGDTVGAEHATFIPLVYNMLDSAPSLKVCRHSCYALNSLMRTVSNETFSKDYLPGLVPRLLDVISSNSNLELTGYVVSTIGTAAEVTGRNYTPYFEQTIKVLEPFVSIQDPSVTLEPAVARTVSSSLGTLSSLCSAVGSEKFAPYLEAWMKTAITCLRSEDSNLRDLAPLYIIDVAEVYRAQFGPYVSVIVPELFKILDEDEITFEEINGDDLDDIDPSEGLKVNSALLLEKEYSLDCLGGLWKHVPAEPYLMPFFEDSLKHFRANIDHYYEDARTSAIVGLWRMFQAMPTNADVKGTAWEATSELFDAETDVTVLDHTFEIIGETAVALGAQVFPNTEAVELLLNNVYEVVSKKHRVFEPEEDDEEKDDAPGEESSESITCLIETSFDLLTKIASVLNADFAPLFPKVAEMLQPYIVSPIDTERTNGIGSIADLIVALKSNITPYTEGILQPLLVSLSDSSDGVRSVAAYGIGVLVEYSDSTAIKPTYATLFPMIGQVLSSATGDRTKANALGAIARLAAKNPDSLPASVSDVVSLVLQHLPLKVAYEEYVAILPWLASVPLPAEAKPTMEALWQQHEEAVAKNAVKSVNYLPTDDPLGDETAMAAWNVIRQKL